MCARTAPAGPFPVLDRLAWAGWASSVARADPENFWAEGNRILENFLTWQALPRPAPGIQRHPVWRSEALELTAYGDADPGPEDLRPSVLCIPSWINSSRIFDHGGHEGHPSLIRFLQNKGLRPFLAEWLPPSLACYQEPAEELVMNYLQPAVEAIRNKTGAPLFLLGYCLGGLAALALAHHTPADGLILVATPWDFEAWPSPVRSWAVWADQAARHLGFFPGVWLQQALGLLNASSDHPWTPGFSEEADHTHTTDWLHSPVDLSAGVARSLFQDWIIQNRTSARTWAAGGTVIHPSTCPCPLLVLEARSDRMVPPMASHPLKTGRNVRVLRADTGHVGLMTSRHAPDQVWGPLVSWIREQTGD